MIERRTQKSRDDWETPESVIKIVKDTFGGEIDLDPCASQDPKKHFAKNNLRDGGLDALWFDNIFINPPYGSQSIKWAEKGYWEYQIRFSTHIWLVAARPGSRWWNTLMSYCAVFAVSDKRLVFGGAKIGAGFPSALIYCGENIRQFIKALPDDWTLYKRI